MSIAEDDAPFMEMAEEEKHEVELARLRAWVSDLQSGMYVNCVYCGHRYGPGETTPVSMANALKMHIEECPKHPMSALKSEVARLQGADKAWQSAEARLVRICQLLGIDYTCEEPDRIEDVIARLRAEVERLTQGNDTQAKSITSLSADLSALAAKETP